jgi:6-phosphogluconolactonase (cycloisomerase 2 family)
MSDSGLFGTATSYGLDAHSGGLTPISHVPANGLAPCWVVLTNDDKYAFITNSLFPPPSISRFRIDQFRIQRNGGLTMLDTTDPVPFGGASGLAAS